MPLEERKARWTVLNDKVRSGSAARWCESFLDTLEGARDPETSGSKPGPGEARGEAPNLVVVPRFRAGAGGDASSLRSAADL
jgi:hypothetical protein